MAAVKITGGDKLAEALKKISKSLNKGGKVKVGFLEGSTYPDGTSVPMVAAIQNYGAPRRGIPPRPFFTNMVKTKSPTWPKAIKENLKETNYDTQTTLERVGAGIASQLQDAIINTNDPPLSPVTVMLRGMRSQGVKITGKTVGEAAQRVKDGKTNYGASTKVLNDTGHLINSVGHKVDMA